jgi:PAS domain S-box-containing protein
MIKYFPANHRYPEPGMSRSATPARSAKPRQRLAKPKDIQAPVSIRQAERQLLKLRKQIAQYETERVLHAQVRQALLDLERRYASLVENIPDIVYSLDASGTILAINKAVTTYGYTQDALAGKSFREWLYPPDQERIACEYRELTQLRKNAVRTQIFRILTQCGEIRWFEANCVIRFDEHGRFLLQEGVCRDITKKTHNEQNLIKAHEELEEKVRVRTHELILSNKELEKEIEERRVMEAILRDRERDLEVEKTNLQESNTALKVLLKRREEDRRMLEEQIQYNVKKLVLPYLGKVQKESLDERHKTYLGIAESNLADITCGFSRRLSLSFYGLTGSELKVADFIRQGRKNREIAHLLGLSIRTVEKFRQSIRGKLLLQNKKINLRTYLMSIK